LQTLFPVKAILHTFIELGIYFKNILKKA